MFVRPLIASDWQDYKRLRLEALQLHAANFGASYLEEASLSDENWREMMSGPGFQRFGLYSDDRQMVGIGGVVTDRNDGRSAILVAGYIRQEYRGKGYSRLLYEARIQWAIDCGQYNRIIVGHHEGNEASRRANQAFGFEYIGAEEKSFGDGSRAIEHQYEVRLK